MEGSIRTLLSYPGQAFGDVGCRELLDAAALFRPAVDECPRAHEEQVPARRHKFLLFGVAVARQRDFLCDSETYVKTSLLIV